MKELKTYEEIQSSIDNMEVFLLYAAGRNCGVCQADAPIVYATLIVVHFLSNFYLKNGPLF